MATSLWPHFFGPCRPIFIVRFVYVAGLVQSTEVSHTRSSAQRQLSSRLLASLDYQLT